MLGKDSKLICRIKLFRLKAAECRTNEDEARLIVCSS